METRDVEDRLQQIWAQTLGLAEVGLDDDFFELGGDSLLAAELLVTIDTTFDVVLPGAALFRSGSIRRLAPAIVAQRDDEQ